jgi:hypothetical protein
VSAVSEAPATTPEPEVRRGGAPTRPYVVATLAVIPAGQWKPTPVRAERRESITVNLGG